MILALAQRLLNRNIAESTPATRLVDDLHDKTLAIEVDGLPLRILLEVSNREVVIRSDRSHAADARVRASAVDLLCWTRLDPRRHIRRAGAQVSGDLEVAECFAQLFRAAKPDFEEELARWIGDVPAHTAWRVLTALENSGSRAVRALESNIAEYLHEESRALPSELELERLYSDIEHVRDDVERCEKRVERLHRKRARS
jgi:ubiquinone biosynthesis protein UbiJ